MVNLLQVIKRTNTAQSPQTYCVVVRPYFFWEVCSNPTIHNNSRIRLSPCRTWKILSPVYPGYEAAWIINMSASISGRPGIRPLQGESVIRLSLGKQLVNLLQMVKRINTLLIPNHNDTFTIISLRFRASLKLRSYNAFSNSVVPFAKPWGFIFSSAICRNHWDAHAPSSNGSGLESFYACPA